MSTGGSYDPHAVETEIYQRWESSGAFHATPSPERQPYVIDIPLPNVTGALHLGHALNNTIQDLLIRVHRMRGYEAMWMPGTDHAGIATQAVVERQLKEKQGITRHELGREGLVKKIWEWKEDYGGRILSQLRRIGSSCDWDRTRFTLDEVCARAVYEVFFEWFKAGLIYRGERLVNWDAHLQTAVADDEIEHKTVQGHLWHYRYPILRSAANQSEREAQASAPGAGVGRATTDIEPPTDADVNAAIARAVAPDAKLGVEYLTIATTRPETMLGDTAIAVHPSDARYQHLIGGLVLLPLQNRAIPVIADGMLVKQEFGTGCVKVTPAHDPNDYACAQRHGLPMINILTKDGRIDTAGGTYVGLDRYDARKQVVADLEQLGLVEKIEDYETEVGHSDRSKTPIEPMLSEQWFVKMADLAETAMEAVRDGRVQFFPERYAKTYLDWLGEKRDWCISRQLWWGHRIPVWSREMMLSELTTADTLFELLASQFVSCAANVVEVHGSGGWYSIQEDADGGQQRLREALDDCDREIRVIVCLRYPPQRALSEIQQELDWVAKYWEEIPADNRDRATQGLRGILASRLKDDGLSDDEIEQELSSKPNTEFRRDFAGFWLARLGFERDPDVLDTWFSSALWPFSTLGWPDNYGKDDQSRDREGAGESAATAEVSDQPAAWTKRMSFAEYHKWCERDHYAMLLAGMDTAGTVVRVRRAGGEEFVIAGAPGAIETLVGTVSPSVPRDETLTWYVTPRDPDAKLIFKNPQDKDWTPPRAAAKKTSAWLEENGFERCAADPQTLKPSTPATDLNFFYPTSVLVTAREIITLWVARMVITGLHFMKRVPFQHVHIHPNIQDGQGRRMAKTIGNGVDPVDIVEQYGADALRFTMAQMDSETQDARLQVSYLCPHCGHLTPQSTAVPHGTYPRDVHKVKCTGCKKPFATGWAPPELKKELGVGIDTSERFEMGRNFCNKIWQVTTGFVLPNLTGATGKATARELSRDDLALEDRWILSRLAATIADIDERLRRYQISDVISTLYAFFWNDFCDWYVELVKPRLFQRDESGEVAPLADESAQVARQVLAWVLDQSLRLLHPVLPFVTEALWAKLNETVPHRGISKLIAGEPLLIRAAWPDANAWQREASVEDELEALQNIIRGLRDTLAWINTTRSAAKTPAIGKLPQAVIRVAEPMATHLRAQTPVIGRLGRCESVEIGPDVAKPAESATKVFAGVEVFVPIAGLADLAAERKRLSKERDELTGYIKGVEAKLNNQGFVAKAPPAVVERERERLGELKEKLAALERNLAELGE